MMLPGEADLRAERRAVVETMSSLSDDELDHGETLCTAWAPRDVLAHLISIDEAPQEYVRAAGNIRAANARMVARYRDLPRADLLERARRWADEPATASRAIALFLLGDTVVHHQDVLRGLGRSRELPVYARDAMLREGLVLGGRRLLTWRVVPVDGGRAMGRGRVVQGTSEALALWLAGRAGLEDELTFVD
jgi:uncharacterized protein (TIGR03083 family)